MTRPKVALGEVMAIDLEPHKVEAGQAYPNIGIYSFGRGTFAKADIEAASTSASTLYRVRAGQVIYSRLFAFEGAYASVPIEHDGAFVSNEFPTFTVNPAKADPRYIAWLFRWSDTWRSLRAGAIGMGDRRQRVHPDRILRHRVSLPPLLEQRRIVACLDAVAAAMAVRMAAAGELEAELAATLAAAFNRITRVAPRSTMGEVAPLVRRTITIDPEAEYAEIGVRSFYRGIFTRRVLKGEDFSWQKLCRVNEGDLVFSNLMAWEQALALAGPEHDGTVGNHRMLTCEVVRSKALPAFLAYYFQTDAGFHEILRASPGTMARNKTLSTKLLPAIPLPLPSLDAQHWFDRLQAKARAARVAQAAATAELDALLPALLHDAFGDADARD